MGSGGTLDELIGAWCGFQTNPVEKADSVLDSALDSDLKVLVHLIGAWCMSRRFRWRTLSMGFTTALPKLLRSQLGNTRREKKRKNPVLSWGWGVNKKKAEERIRCCVGGGEDESGVM